MAADRIERDVSIAAPIERVWSVITEPEHVGQWFGIGEPTAIDLKPGGLMVLDHGANENHPGRMQFPTKIVVVEPPRYFSYRWASGYPGVEATEENSTLVEFTLTEEGDGTRLTVVESGFASLEIPAGMQWGASYESHSAGWTEKVEDIRAYAEKLLV